MKVLLVAAVLVLALIMPSQGESCRQEPDRCGDDECCVEFGMFGKCRPLLKEGDVCELRPLQPSREDHVYMMMCPCGEGLTCEDHEDIPSTLQGKCVKQ